MFAIQWNRFDVCRLLGISWCLIAYEYDDAELYISSNQERPRVRFHVRFVFRIHVMGRTIWMQWCVTSHQFVEGFYHSNLIHKSIGFWVPSDLQIQSCSVSTGNAEDTLRYINSSTLQADIPESDLIYIRGLCRILPAVYWQNCIVHYDRKDRWGHEMEAIYVMFWNVFVSTSSPNQ